MEVLNYDRFPSVFPTRGQAKSTALAYLSDEPEGCYFVAYPYRTGWTVDLYEEDGYHIGRL